MDPATEPAEFEAKRAAGKLSALGLRWHQWVGVVTALDNMLRGKPMLILDDVGIGKTLETFGIISCLEWMREWKSTHGQWPGMFGKSFIAGVATPS